MSDSDFENHDSDTEEEEIVVDYSMDFDTSSLRCFKQIELSSSSIFKHPLYYFPELFDPGILEAFKFEPLPEIDNDIGRERYLRICKELNVVPLKRVLSSLDQEELDLRFYRLNHNELRALFHVLEINGFVKILLLQDSWLKEETVHLLSNILCYNGSIRILNLKQCKIGQKGIQELNEGLKTNSTLEELDLCYNAIEDEGLRSLRETFKNNDSLKKINLAHNNLTGASANILQFFFSNHESIEDINLEWNNLCSDEGFKKIGVGLCKSNIKVLNLAWNNLGSMVIAKVLAKFIRESTTLEFLDLSSNKFKEASAEVLKAALKVSKSLKCFRFGNNPLNVDEVAAFGSTLLENENLIKLDLENLYFPKYFNSNLKKIRKLGKELVYGGIIGNYDIKGPNKCEVLLRRCHYLGLAPKRPKAKRDFGHIALTFPEEIMQKADFENFVRRKKKGKMYDIDLLSELQKTFSSGKTKINTKYLLSEYMRLYPDTSLPPPKPKKKKKQKQVKSVTTTTATSTETELTVAFNIPDKLQIGSQDEIIKENGEEIGNSNAMEDNINVVEKKYSKEEVEGDSRGTSTNEMIDENRKEEES